MKDFEIITDYTEKTKNLIPSRLRGKPLFNGILESVDTQLEEFEVAAETVLTDIWLDTAAGVQLDLLGRDLGLSRRGADDETYRALLNLKIRINTGGGEPELLIAVVKELYNATSVHYIPDYPAGVIIEHDGSIGLFTLTELELDTGDFMIIDTGETLFLREPDTSAEALLDLVIPAGVSLTVNAV